MAIFIDTGVFVAVRNKRDKNHARGRELMEKALKGDYGVIYTSDYVIDESVMTALARTHDYQIALNTGRLIIESPRIEKVYTSSAEFQMAWLRFQKLRQRPMSFTDCVSLSHMEKRGVERIMSFDSEFDGQATRIH